MPPPVDPYMPSKTPRAPKKPLSKYAERQKRLRAEHKALQAEGKSNLPKVPAWLEARIEAEFGVKPEQPSEPEVAALGGFSAFDANDYAVRTGEGKTARMLTVSPLRALMREQQDAIEHVVTERTRQGVLYGAGLGMEVPVLARIMGLDVEELQALYPAELATAPHLMMSDIQTNLYNIARDPQHPQSVRAGQYLLARLGNKLYREEQKSQAVVVRPETRTVDVSLLNDEQRDALKDILSAALRLATGEPQYEQAPIEGEYDEIEDDPESVL